MGYAGTSRISRQGGLLFGEPRVPVNIARERAGSIHDDARAIDLGFRGGLVSGLVHNEQLPPLALALFGQRWFERGSYSMYYRVPTLDGEPVRAFARDPGPVGESAQVETWIETEARERVAEGTLAAGDPGEPSALAQRLANRHEPGDLRILRPAEPGTPIGEERRVRWPLERQLPYRDTITEPLDWYFGASPWGGPICASLALYRMLRPAAIQDFVKDERAVQVDGGIEVRFLDGPVFLDRDYLLTASVLAMGETPRTEYLWFESELRPVDGGPPVAKKLMMCRWLKASSHLYAGG